MQLPRLLMAYDPRLHDRRSIRLPAYDYSQGGVYFVTLCIQDRAWLFGRVVNGQMRLNAYGQAARDAWVEAAEAYGGVDMGVFVIMPDHMHGIVGIGGGGKSDGEVTSGEGDS